MSRKALLLFAMGRREELKQSYLAFYHVTPSGEISSHSCEKCFGESTFIRLCKYNGEYREVDVPDEAIQAFLDTRTL
jgi:hypothetical protein